VLHLVNIIKYVTRGPMQYGRLFLRIGSDDNAVIIIMYIVVSYLNKTVNYISFISSNTAATMLSVPTDPPLLTFSRIRLPCFA